MQAASWHSMPLLPLRRAGISCMGCHFCRRMTGQVWQTAAAPSPPGLEQSWLVLPVHRHNVSKHGLQLQPFHKRDLGWHGMAWHGRLLLPVHRLEAGHTWACVSCHCCGQVVG